jgi:ribosomal protein S27E
MDERIALMRDDPAVWLTVDGNAIAGVLVAVFGREVTALEERCAHCDTVSVVGTLRVYMRGPGIVVRCPACAEVMLRIVETPTGTRVDLSGATHLAAPLATSPASRARL